jgi:hypothetical protein
MTGQFDPRPDAPLPGLEDAAAPPTLETMAAAGAAALGRHFAERGVTGAGPGLTGRYAESEDEPVPEGFVEARDQNGYRTFLEYATLPQPWQSVYAAAVPTPAAAPPADGPPSFTCPDCHMVSIHPDDVANGYCGQCSTFPGDRAYLAELATGTPGQDISAGAEIGWPARGVSHYPADLVSMRHVLACALPRAVFAEMWDDTGGFPDEAAAVYSRALVYRTAEEMAARIKLRWETRYAKPLEVRRPSSWAAVLADLVAPPHCADLRCENGRRQDTGEACPNVSGPGIVADTSAAAAVDAGALALGLERMGTPTRSADPRVVAERITVNRGWLDAVLATQAEMLGRLGAVDEITAHASKTVDCAEYDRNAAQAEIETLRRALTEAMAKLGMIPDDVPEFVPADFANNGWARDMTDSLRRARNAQAAANGRAEMFAAELAALQTVGDGDLPVSLPLTAEEVSALGPHGATTFGTRIAVNLTWLHNVRALIYRLTDANEHTARLWQEQGARLNAVYRERSLWAAIVVGLVGGGRCDVADPAWPGWPGIYADAPNAPGQISALISPEDAGLLAPLRALETNPWDGHNKEQRDALLVKWVVWAASCGRTMVPLSPLDHRMPPGLTRS